MALRMTGCEWGGGRAECEERRCVGLCIVHSEYDSKCVLCLAECKCDH